MNKGNTPQAGHHSILKRLTAGVLLLNSLVAVSLWYSLQNSKTHYREKATVSTQGIVQLLDEHLAHVFKEIDLSLLAVSDEAERQLAGGVIHKEALDDVIIRQHSRLPELASFRATDPSGDAVYGPKGTVTSTTSLAHRDYFKLLRDTPNAGMVISKPLVGGISGKWMVVVARRINGPGGAFAGLVYVGLGLEHLNRTFKDLGIGAGGSIALLDEDSALVARYPEAGSIGAEIGRRISFPQLLDSPQTCKLSTPFKMTSPVDGMERTYSYCRLSSQPFYLLAEVSAEDYLADWYAEVYKTSLLGAAFFLVTLLSAWGLCREWNRARTAEKALLTLNEDLEARVLERTQSAENTNKVLQTIIECMSDWVWDVDANGRYTYCSPQVETHLGYRPEEMVGRTPCDFMSDEEAARVRVELASLVRQGLRIRGLESWFIARDGRKVLCSTNAAPVFDDKGNLAGYRGVDTDLTERRLAEESLRDSETNFRAFFETMTDMIVVANTQGRVLLNNTAATRMLGYSSEELANMYILDLHPEDKRGEAEAIFASMLRRERETCPLPLAAKTGAIVPVETHVWFGRWNGADCVFGICKDLTAEQEAQQRFERLFHNNPAPMAVTILPDQRFSDVNKALLETLHYSRDEVIGKTAVELGFFLDPEAHAEAGRRLKMTGRLSNVTLQVRRKDGVILDGLFSGEMISNQGREYFLTVMIDITDRRRAEDALRIAHGFSESIIEHAGDGLSVCHEIPAYPYVEFTVWNRRMQEITGYSIEEINRLGWYQTVYPDASLQEQARERMGRMRSGEDLQGEEWEITRSDGQKRILQITTTLIQSSDGFTHVLALMHDSTDGKRAEDELRRASALVDTIVENIPNMIFLKDARDLRFVRFNKAGEDLLGFSRDELLGKNDYDFFPKEQADFFTEKDKNVLKGRGLVDIPEEPLQTRRKGIRTLHTKKVALLDANGEPEYLLGISEDITEHRQALEALRKSEEKYRGIFDESVAAIFAFDNNQRFIDANQAGLDLLGYARDELLRMSIPDVGADPVVLLPAPQDLSSGGRLVNREYRFRRKDGRVITVLNNSRPFTDSHGNIVGMLSTLIDITEIKQAEDVLRTSLQEREVLLREIHHRVKNNMQVISGLLTLQADRVENEEVRQALVDSQQRIVAMAMIHEALYGGPNLAVVDLSTYLRNLTDHLRGIYSSQADVDITLEVEDIQLGIDQAVPSGLIINELVTNALKHAFPGDRKGALEIKIYAVNETEVVMVVRDDGVGLSADLDLNNPSSLGLRLVQGLLTRQLKGRLEVVTDGGTAFTLRWPLPAGRGGQS